MNYYERHIGDYLKDTAHLSLLEHGVYSRLLDVYYTRETALDAVEVARLIGARTAAEKSAVKTILAEFFYMDGLPPLWYHKRCAVEIDRYRDKQNKARTSAQIGVAMRQTKADLTSRELRSARMSAAKEKGTHTKEEWAALREFCDFKCVKCHAEGHQDRDHIVPVYQGGSDSIHNIQPLCARCNASKGPDVADHRPSGWLAFVERSLNVGLAPSLQSPDSKHQSPPPIDSEAIASAALAARSAEVGAMAKAELWNAGKSLLSEQGMPAAQCGSFVGALVKAHGEQVVIDAVRAAVLAQPADAASYLKGCCKGKHSGAPKSEAERAAVNALSTAEAARLLGIDSSQETIDA